MSIILFTSYIAVLSTNIVIWCKMYLNKLTFNSLGVAHKCDVRTDGQTERSLAL